MKRLHNSLALPVLLPGFLIVDNLRHATVDLRDNSFAKTTVKPRTLFVENADCEVNNGQNIVDKGHSVGDDFCDFRLQFLETVL